MSVEQCSKVPFTLEFHFRIFQRETVVKVITVSMLEEVIFINFISEAS